MKRRRRSAVRGRHSTNPTPSTEELLGIVIDRREAHEHGHIGSLFDELTAARQTAMEASPRQDLKDTDLVSIPLWAFEAAAQLVENRLLDGSAGRGRHARWWRQYREDQIQWHRYALTRQRMTDGTGAWPDNAAGKPDVFTMVSRELHGTLFAGRPSTMRKSYETVAAALKNGEHHRYYRSTAVHVYDFLLNTKDVASQRGAGANYGHVYIKSSQ